MANGEIQAFSIPEGTPVSPPTPSPQSIALGNILQSGAVTGQYARWSGVAWVPFGPVPLTDIAQSGALDNQGIRWNGTNWIPSDGNRTIARRTTSTGAIANTETQVISATVPANRMQVGTTFELEAVGAMTKIAAQTLATFRVRIGPVTLTGAIPASSPRMSAGGAVTNAIFTVKGLITIRSIGGAGTAIGQIVCDNGWYAAGTTAADGTLVPVIIDTTIANIVEMTFISGTALTHTALFTNAVIKQLEA